MADRRQVLKAGLSGSLLPLGVLASSADGAERLSVRRAVYDRRFAAGRAFAAEAAGRGWPSAGIAGDVTDLWYEDLAPIWRQGPAPVAGVTTPSSLFVLERLAWDAGLRVASRTGLKHEPVIAWLIAPRAGRGRA